MDGLYGVGDGLVFRLGPFVRFLAPVEINRFRQPRVYNMCPLWWGLGGDCTGLDGEVFWQVRSLYLVARGSSRSIRAVTQSGIIFDIERS